MKRFGAVRVDAAMVFLAALWLVCLYRAITQSIVHDEALTWELYLAGPASVIFAYFDANHHFLNTLLMRVSTGLLGFSEFSMRLPALCAAALWFAAVYRIARRLTASKPLALVICAALTLNPILMDFMVAARGYGMALAFFAWAFATMMPLLERQSMTNRDLLRCAIALSLSVMANLTFLIPVAILAGCVFFLQRSVAPAPLPASAKKRSRDKAPAKKAVSSIWRWFVLPIAACAVAFGLAAPLDVARSKQFYVGTPSIASSLRNLASVSLLYARWAQRVHAASAIRDVIAFGIAPAIVLGGLVAGFVRRDRLLLVPSLVAAGSWCVLVMAHGITGMPLPVDRTGLYFPALIALILVLLSVRAFRPLWAFVGIAIVASAAQFNVRSFYVWDYDADTRTIANLIARRHASNAPESVHVGASWKLEPALNYYRVTNQLSWMQPVDRRPIRSGAPFYAITAEDQRVIGELGLKAIYKGEVSGTVLAVPEP